MVIICDVWRDEYNNDKFYVSLSNYQGMIVWYVSDVCCGVGIATISSATSARSPRWNNLSFRKLDLLSLYI